MTEIETAIAAAMASVTDAIGDANELILATNDADAQAMRDELRSIVDRLDAVLSGAIVVESRAFARARAKAAK